MLSAASDGLDAPLFSAYRCRDSHTAPAFDDSRLFDAEMARDMRCVGEMAINTGLARLFLAATQLELCLVRIRLLGAANPLVEDRVLNIDRAGEIAGGRGSKHCRGDRLGEAPRWRHVGHGAIDGIDVQPQDRQACRRWEA